MPGSCEADNNSSSSLVSSLRKYRLKERPKYRPLLAKESPQSNTNNSQGSDSDKSSKSTSSNLTQSTPQRSNSELSSPASTSNASQSYSPLSYRKYEISHTSSFILPHVLTKIQQTIKKSKPGLVDLPLALTEDEYTKFKEIVLKEPYLGENWNTSVIETSSYITCGTRELKVNRLYLIELRRHLSSNLLNSAKNSHSSLQPEAAPNNFKPVKTYSRTPKNPNKPKIVQPTISQEIPDNNTLKPEIPTKGIMDEYEVFCEKEQSLRKLLDAFPGADIMEGQDILVRCNWDIGEAIKIAHSMPLRCSKKKALQYAASHGNQSPEPENNQSSSSSTNHKMAEEILLDSSDEEIDNAIQGMNNKRSVELERNYAPAAKRTRILSSSDSENENTDVLKSKTSTTSVVSPTYTTTPIASSTASETTFTMSKSITIKSVSITPVSDPPKEKSVPSVSEPSKEKTSNNGDMPSFPKGLSITQLGSSTITKLVSKNEIPEENGNKKTVNMVNQKAEVITVASPSQSSNSNKPALLVRIKKSNKSTSNGLDGDNSVGYTIQNARSLVSPSEFDKDTSPVSSKPASDDDIIICPSEEPRKKSRKKEKMKRKKYALSDDDDEDYGNVDIYNSDDSDIEENLTPAHSAVLRFFQEASAEELSSIPSCSKKKVETLLNIRPLANWADLVLKLSSDKLLSTDLLNGAKKVLDMRNAVNKLMAKCQQISLDMEDLVESLKEKRESSLNYVAKQPELLNENMHLAPYQMLGLNWLLLLHNQEVNGILADEMGLGKTVQALSFLAYLKQIGEIGPHLIVVPSSTLDNWRLEAIRWWPSVSILLYHGSQEARRELRFKVLNDEVDEFDVMITTYNMITSSSEDRGFFKRLEFLYVIFDEAHMLKNMASQRYQHLMKIKAPRRLLLTGTPLQNNLVELMSLLIFAMPDMFSGKTEQVKQMFTAVSKSDGNKNSYEKERIEHAKRIMKPFVLRRLKREVLKDLPEKHEEIRRCPMVEDQEIKYQRLVEKFSAEVENNQEGSEKMSSSGAGMMMQLRRGANHPLLLKEFYDDDKLMEMSKEILKEPTHVQSDPNLVFEDMSIMSDFELHKLCQQFQSLNSFALSDEQILNSGKFKVLDELLPDLIDEGHRVLLFSQFTMVLDIIEEYMHIRQYMYFRLDGQTPVSERQEMIDQFNNDPSISLFLLSTRAGGLGINLTAADTVIIHDIDFNPYNDKQAEDRCHRVGQTKDVTVVRFISANTIEENILHSAKEKLKLEKDIHDETDTEENDSANVAKLLRDALGLKNTKS